MQLLKSLIELQQIDRMIYRRRKSQAGIPEQIAHLQETLRRHEQLLKQQEEAVLTAQRRHKEKDLELQQCEESVRKKSAQLFQVKTNKEYSALQLEIEKQKADNSLLEEQIINLLDTIEQTKQSRDTAKKELAAEQQRIAEEQRRLQQDMRQVEEDLAQGTAERSRLIEAADIEKKVLALYERILANKGESALAVVRNQSCQACHMSVRAQLLSELKLGKIITCESCQRILIDEAVYDEVPLRS